MDHAEAQYSDTAIVDTASDTSADNTSDKDSETGGEDITRGQSTVGTEHHGRLSCTEMSGKTAIF